MMLDLTNRCRFQLLKIWTMDRLHIQREIHNSIIITMEPRGEDGTAGAGGKLKVSCEDKTQQWTHQFRLKYFCLFDCLFVFQSEEIIQQTKRPKPAEAAALVQKHPISYSTYSHHSLLFCFVLNIFFTSLCWIFV